MNSFLRKEWWLPRKKPICPNSPSWKTRMCPTSMSWRSCSLRSPKAMWSSCLTGDISIGTLQTSLSTTSVITFTYLQRSYLTPCSVVILKVTGLVPRVQYVSDGQISQERGRQRHTLRGPDKKIDTGTDLASEFQFRGGFGYGCGQPPQWSWRLCCIE